MGGFVLYQQQEEKENRGEEETEPVVAVAGRKRSSSSNSTKRFSMGSRFTRKVLQPEKVNVKKYGRNNVRNINNNNNTNGDKDLMEYAMVYEYDRLGKLGSITNEKRKMGKVVQKMSPRNNPVKCGAGETLVGLLANIFL